MNEIAQQALEFLQSGFKVFPIHPFNSKVCGCSDDNCTAAGKHPSITSWNKVPLWSDEQFQTMVEVGEFDYGYGVLTEKLLIVDIDVRNDGDEASLPEDLQSGFVVASGSGDGSTHHYFTIDESLAVNKNLKEYPGIDFITTSRHFVVGPESKHKSGSKYKIIEGSIKDIEPAPQWLIELIKKPDRIRIKDDSHGYIDMTGGELKDCVMAIKDFDTRDNWVQVGMAIHNSTSGSTDGYDIWDEWSRQSKKYNSDDQLKTWMSFKDHIKPVTYATLKFLAQQDGWVEPVTFDNVDFDVVDCKTDLPFPVNDLDMLKPPGFVGEITEWINDQCAYPRERLAVATALSSIGDIGGLNTVLDDEMTRANTLFFCVAGSSSGKEALLQAKYQLLDIAGIAPVIHGKWKSEQEIVRNLTRHDQSSYVIDEIGIQLGKLQSASKSGGAVYLEGVIGEIMSIYSKSLGLYAISGDLKEELIKQIDIQIARVNRSAKSGAITDQDAEDQVNQYNKDKEIVMKGVKNPFLSVIGFTTPQTFESTISYDNITNGFLARALLVDEIDTNPRRKPRFKRRHLPDTLRKSIRALHTIGNYEIGLNRKIKASDELSIVNSTDEALEYIELVYEYQHEQAEKEKEATGYESIWRRLQELTNTISLILALPSGVRTADHVRWSFEYCRRNCQRKIELGISAAANNETSKLEQLANKLMTIIDDQAETAGTIVNRCRSYKKDDVIKTLDLLAHNDQITVTEHIHPVNGNKIFKYTRNY